MRPVSGVAAVARHRRRPPAPHSRHGSADLGPHSRPSRSKINPHGIQCGWRRPRLALSRAGLDRAHAPHVHSRMRQRRQVSTPGRSLFVVVVVVRAFFVVGKAGWVLGSRALIDVECGRAAYGGGSCGQNTISCQRTGRIQIGPWLWSRLQFPVRLLADDDASDTSSNDRRSD